MPGIEADSHKGRQQSGKFNLAKIRQPVLTSQFCYLIGHNLCDFGRVVWSFRASIPHVQKGSGNPYLARLL